MSFNGNRAAGDGGGLVKAKDTVTGSFTDAFDEFLKAGDRFRSEILDPNAKNGFKIERAEAEAKPKLSDKEAQAVLVAGLDKTHNLYGDQAEANTFGRVLKQPWNLDYKVAA